MAKEEGVDMVIQIMLAIFLGAILFPIALNNWFGDNVTTYDHDGNASTPEVSWFGGAENLWPVIPVMALIGVVYLFYNKYVD